MNPPPTINNEDNPQGNGKSDELSLSAQIEEMYNRRLDTEIEQIIDSIGDIIKVSKVSLYLLLFSLKFVYNLFITFNLDHSYLSNFYIWF